eukprot:7705379-Alexandrium_andersonii.AAC.1
MASECQGGTSGALTESVCRCNESLHHRNRACMTTRVTSRCRESHLARRGRRTSMSCLVCWDIHSGYCRLGAGKACASALRKWAAKRAAWVEGSTCHGTGVILAMSC